MLISVVVVSFNSEIRLITTKKRSLSSTFAHQVKEVRLIQYELI